MHHGRTCRRNATMGSATTCTGRWRWRSPRSRRSGKYCHRQNKADFDVGIIPCPRLSVPCPSCPTLRPFASIIREDYYQSPLRGRSSVPRTLRRLWTGKCWEIYMDNTVEKSRDPTLLPAQTAANSRLVRPTPEPAAGRRPGTDRHIVYTTPKPVFRTN